MVVGREHVRSAGEHVLVALAIAGLSPRRGVVREEDLREPLLGVWRQEPVERGIEIDLVAAEQRHVRLQAVGQ
jgi:hypothetical protein